MTNIYPKATPCTNDMFSLLASLEDIASHPGSKVKEALLEHYLDYTVFRHLVDYLLNPYLRYGITSYGTFEVIGDMLKDAPADFNELSEFLGKLARRELTGNVARDKAGVLVCRGVPGELMTRILNKDPKAGFGDTMVNKVMKGLLPEFPYMRCSLPAKSNMSKWDWSKGIYSQLKADGMFMNVDIDEAGQVQLMSRQGSIFPEQGFISFHDTVRRFLKHGTQTHGEMVVYQDDKLLDRQTGNGIINSVVQGGTWPEGARIQFLAWDQIPLAEVKAKGKYKVPYKFRLESLEEQLKNVGPFTQIQINETELVYSLQEAYAHFKKKLLNKKEGTVVKSPYMDWADGTSKDQVKLKLAFIVDLKIVGYVPGKGKNAKTFGSVMTESGDGLLKVNVSGMDDKTRQYIHDNRERLLGTIIAVEGNALFAPSPSSDFWSLSHPRFIDFCTKPDADSLARIMEQEAAAMEAAANL